MDASLGSCPAFKDSPRGRVSLVVGLCSGSHPSNRGTAVFLIQLQFPGISVQRTGLHKALTFWSCCSLVTCFLSIWHHSAFSIRNKIIFLSMWFFIIVMCCESAVEFPFKRCLGWFSCFKVTFSQVVKCYIISSVLGFPIESSLFLFIFFFLFFLCESCLEDTVMSSI